MMIEFSFPFDGDAFARALDVANDAISEQQFRESEYKHSTDWRWLRFNEQQAPIAHAAFTQAGLAFKVSEVLTPEEWDERQRQREAEADERRRRLAAQLQTETKDEKIARLVREGLIVVGCKGCAVKFENPDAMNPSHNASSRCLSGKRNHCTCDTCF